MNLRAESAALGLHVLALVLICVALKLAAPVLIVLAFVSLGTAWLVLYAKFSRARERRRDLAVLYHVAVHGAVPLIEAGLDSPGSVHTRLRRLVQEGFLCVRETAPLPERGQRPRFCYRLSAAGGCLVILDVHDRAGGVL